MAVERNPVEQPGRHPTEEPTEEPTDEPAEDPTHTAGYVPATALGATRFAKGELRAGIVLVVGWAVVGVLTGIAWSRLAPHVVLIATPGGPQFEDPTARSFFTDDLVFLLVTSVLGIVGGVAAWSARRLRGPVMLAGAVLGATACAVIAWRIGHQLGLSAYRKELTGAAPGSRILRPVSLATHSWLMIQPLFAALAYVLLAIWTKKPDLGRSREPEPVDDPEPLDQRDQHESDQFAH